ncbi:hypothetical protein H9X57_15305 [Flavobacterium piscinae]|uniref:hypothetical protein n=1 Tax=Flavobacterium piscinae TaxID=2506424 RepID=UPI0019C098DB|nr:hypothetical protein [Flavobacterium piscinae]MBC8884239.1 hypothetical protein [Flavobacterium piscinae]
MKTKFYLFLLISIIANYGYAQNTTYGVNANPNNYGQLNTAIGREALYSTNNESNENVAIGDSTIYSNSSGFYNIGIGVSGLYSNTTGSRNVSLGRFALHDNTVGNGNVSIGDNSMQFNVNGGYNVAIGSQSLRKNNSGINNVAIGINSLYSNNNGKDNIAIGSLALSGIESNNSVYYNNGDNNIALGAKSLNSLTEGNNNIAQGSNSLLKFDNGSGNIVLGFNAGRDLVNGSNNILLGNNCNSPTTTSLNNTLVINSFNDPIGNIRKHSLIFGEFHTSTTNGRYLKFNVNSGSNSRVEIESKDNNTSGLKFTKLTSSFNPSVSSSKFLTVNSTGDVVLQNIPLGSGGTDINIYNDNGELSGDRKMNMNNFNLHFDTSTSSSTTGKIYIGDTPDYPTTTGNYKLYVEGGILTEKVKVALRNPNTNWADYVFADDYKLQSLKEVETFIKANKHLPGIESAQELVENGLDLADMQAKQMGKIEELTLYIIEQDKKLEQQSKDIEELKALVKVLMDKK